MDFIPNRSKSNVMICTSDLVYMHPKEWRSIRLDPRKQIGGQDWFFTSAHVAKFSYTPYYVCWAYHVTDTSTAKCTCSLIWSKRVSHLHSSFAKADYIPQVSISVSDVYMHYKCDDISESSSSNRQQTYSGKLKLCCSLVFNNAQQV